MSLEKTDQLCDLVTSIVSRRSCTSIISSSASTPCPTCWMTTALDWFDIGGCRASYTILFVKPFRIPMNLETFSHLVTLTMAVCTGESGSIPKSLGRSCNNLQQHVSFNGEADPFCFHSVSTLGDVLVLFLSDHPRVHLVEWRKGIFTSDSGADITEARKVKSKQKRVHSIVLTYLHGCLLQLCKYTPYLYCNFAVLPTILSAFHSTQALDGHLVCRK